MESYFAADSAGIILFVIILALFSLPFLFGRKKVREGYYCFRRVVMGMIVLIFIFGTISVLLLVHYPWSEPEPGTWSVPGASPLIIVATLAFTLYGSYLLWHTPDEMAFDPEGNLVLKNLFYKKIIPPEKINSLTISALGYGAACWIGYEGGRALLPGNFEGKIEFVSRLKEANPHIKTKGL